MLDTVIPVPRSRAFNPDAAARGIQIYVANPRRGMKAAYNDLDQEAQAAGWRIGEYSTYTRLLGKVDPGVLEYQKKGQTGFELGIVPKILRAWLSVPVYSVLCGDQNIPDYEVVDPATGEVYTPELYLWMDCTSRAWVGLWPAWGHYNRYTVGYSLREACRLGNPEEIFTDWGKPELSRHVATIRTGLDGLIACGDWSDYAIHHADADAFEVEHRKTTRVGIPWQKPIENQMNCLKRGLLDLDLPGFRQRQPGAWENDTAMARLAAELSRVRKGERIQVSFDPFDREREAILTTPDGDFVGLAEPWNVQQPGDRPELSRKIQRQMALMKWWRKQVQSLCGAAAKQAASVPRIGAATKVARAAEAAIQAKPDKGARKRAEAFLINKYLNANGTARD
jgi:hypothetical protein